MSANYDKLKEKLKEIFQLDQADLDFGIYRILNTKAEEIERYLDKDLKKQVKEILSDASTDDLEEVRDQIAQIEQEAKKYKADPNDNAEYIELKARLAGSVDLDALEKEIFSDLYNFFSRYYEGGDFLSLRRYKEGVYAIPYEGEEVKLHWANSDQYYIKTSEYFTNYSFKLPEGKRVHFRLIKAGTEANNNKAQEGKDRRFILSAAEEARIENDELVIPFEYRPDESKRTQKTINEATVETLRSDKTATAFAPDLFTEIERASGGRWTALEKHLNDYTAKNEFDYFIHKDLGGFMRRELDFFIKNEILYLDDMIDQKPKDFEKRLAKLKALKTIGHKIIAFLAQLEEFQKKLWLKKKFVVETNWCITLDRVPEELYAEIAANDAQRDEWVKLFAIDDLDGYADFKRHCEDGQSPGAAISFLKDNPTLVLDTAFFPYDFKTRLLESIDNIDEQTDGLLIQSDNFQALAVLQNKYKQTIKCVYIDPPYNTEKDRDTGKFIYKDSFDHSSWNAFLYDRTELAKNIMSLDGVYFSSIDHNEIASKKIICEDIFGSKNFHGIITWRRRHNQPNDKTKMIGMVSEYIITYSRDLNAYKNYGVGKLDVTGKFSNPDNDPKGDWASKPWKVGSDQSGSRYVITTPTGKKLDEEWMGDEDTYNKHLTDNRIYFPDSGNGSPRKKYYRFERDEEGQCATNWWPHEQFGHNQGANDLLTSFFGEKNKFSNPKPPELIRATLLLAKVENQHTVLDYFAGSGTTGHAVINLNREDDGRRKYILVEMGEYFDVVTKPRIQKVIYSKDWKNGKPVSREGISHCFKYIRLESYEDALNNLTLKRDATAQGVLDSHDAIREQYLLHYMLDTESKGSVLDLDAFAKPFDYQLMINRNDDLRPRNVDLVETFNYLIGLNVERMRFIEDVYVVNGKTRDGEALLILWRDASTLDAAGLDDWFETHREALLLADTKTIYVNGDNTLQGQAGKGDNWSVKLIEEAFHRLMFGTGGL